MEKKGLTASSCVSQGFSIMGMLIGFQCFPESQEEVGARQKKRNWIPAVWFSSSPLNPRPRWPPDTCRLVPVCCFLPRRTWDQFISSCNTFYGLHIHLCLDCIKCCKQLRSNVMLHYSDQRVLIYSSFTLINRRRFHFVKVSEQTLIRMCLCSFCFCVLIMVVAAVSVSEMMTEIIIQCRRLSERWLFYFTRLPLSFISQRTETNSIKLCSLCTIIVL